jgi:hypothetical protein
MLFFKVFGLNLLLTILECGLFGPAASKLDSFGLRGWAGRAPFLPSPLVYWPRYSFLPLVPRIAAPERAPRVAADPALGFLGDCS